MADLYKEYLAYVPSKWAAFTDGRSAPRKAGKFSHCLPRGERETAEFKAAVDREEALIRTVGSSSIAASGSHDGGGGGTVRGPQGPKKGPMGQRWIDEMTAQVAEDKARAEAEARAHRLEERLALSHERRIARKELEMMPPTLDGSPMPANFHSLAADHPHEVARYHAMLAAGGAVALSAARSRTLETTTRQQETVDSAARKHHDRIVANAARAVEARHAAAEEMAEEHEAKLRRAKSRCTDRAVEADEHRQREAEKAAAHRAAAEAKLAAAQVEREREAEARQAEAEGKRARRLQATEEQTAAFDAKMKTIHAG